MATMIQALTANVFKVYVVKPRANISSAALWLYKLTSLGMVTASGLSIAKQYFGEPIHCLAQGHLGYKEFVNNYCWSKGTFVYDTLIGADVASDTGMKYTGRAHVDYEDEVMVSDPGRQKHGYYQWVAIVLCLQVRKVEL